MSPPVQPGSTRTVRAAGSTRTLFMRHKSMTRPSSQVPRPPPLWPPPRIAVSRLLVRAKLTVSITSAASTQRTISRRPLVDHAVVYAAGGFVVDVTRLDDQPPETRAQGFDVSTHHEKLLSAYVLASAN